MAHTRELSAEVQELAAYAFDRGGKSPVVFTDNAVAEAVRAGLVELVVVGVNEPYIVLTPGGLSYCRSKKLQARPASTMVRSST